MSELEYEGRILNGDLSPEDDRDFVFLDTAVELPARFVVKGSLPLYDQRNTGTCSAHAAAAIRVWQERLDGKGIIPVDIFRLYDLVKTIVDKRPDPLRVMGTHIRSVLRLLAGTGTPLKGTSQPGAGGKITTYWRVYGENAMKQALMKYGPLMARADWDAAWMYLPPNRILRAPLGRIVGGHIFVIYGWDDARGWLIHNSWGRWSLAGTGNAYMRFAYFAARRPEAWATTDIDD